MPENSGQRLDMPRLPFVQNFNRAFVRMDPVNVPAKFEVRSFTRSWDNRGYLKTLGSPWIRRSMSYKVTDLVPIDSAYATSY